MKKTHIAGGVLLGSIMIDHHKISESLIPVAMSASILGSLLPDIDHRNSYIGRRLKVTSWIASKTLGHRGATHSPIFTGLFLLTLQILIGRSKLYVNLNVLTVVNTFLYYGILSHIFLDSLTPGGVPLLYPIFSNKISFFNIKTGGTIESLFRYILYVAIYSNWIPS